MPRYGSLYDSYRLSNSSVIPMYQGSAAPEALQVGQYEQSLYNTAQAGAFGIGANADNVQSLDKDSALASDLRSQVQNKLKEFATRGDYENMVPAVQQLSADFINRSRELAAPLQQFQKWNESLDNKDLGLTPWQKMGLRAQAMSNYGGLKKDATGRYVGRFSGPDIAENVDTVKWVKDALDGIAIQKGGTEWYTDPGGDFIIKQGDKREVLSKAQIETVLKNAMDMDPKLQAHMAQMGDIAGYYASKQIPDQLSDAGKKEYNDYITKGYTQQQAMQMVGASTQRNRISQDILNFGDVKYGQNNHWTTMDATGKPSAMRPKDPISTSIVVPGPDVKANPDEYDYNKINKNVTDLTSQSQQLDKEITNNERLLSKANGTAYSIISSKLDQLRQQRQGVQLSLNRSNQIIDYAKQQTAADMNYSSYDDYIKHTSGAIKEAVGKVLGNRVVATPSGRKINATEIAEAIADGRATPVRQVFGGAGGASAPVNVALDIRLKDGSRVRIGKNGMGDKIADAIETYRNVKSNQVDAFNNKLQENLKNGVGNRALKSNYVTLSDDQTNELNKAISVGGGKGFDLTLPGDYMNPIPDKNKPVSMKVTGVNTVAPNGVVTVAVQGYDKDGKPVPDQVYEAHLPSTSVARYLGNDWMKQNIKGQYPELGAAANSLMPGVNGQPSGASQITTDSPGVLKDLGEVTVSGKQYGKVFLLANGDRYDIVDATGKIITIPVNGKPTQMSTSDLNKAGSWIDYMQNAQ
jgi:hypothetical protein